MHIGVVNPYHLPSSLFFIQAGKNVLCEKPMGMNAAEVKTMVNAAREKEVFFMEVGGKGPSPGHSRKYGCFLGNLWHVRLTVNTSNHRGSNRWAYRVWNCVDNDIKSLFLLSPNEGDRVFCSDIFLLPSPLTAIFLHQGLWSRFFPAAERIRTLLHQGSIGEVMVLHAEFGSPQLSIPRCVEKELGGGGLLDIGCYCIQLACMVFNREKPQSILASGFLHDTG